MSSKDDRLPTSSTLLQRVSSGDRESCDLFYRIYAPLIAAYVGLIVRGWSVHDDDKNELQQETWKKILLAMPKFELERHRGRFRSWLFLLAKNVAKDWNDKRHRHRRKFQPGQETDWESPPPELDASHKQQVLKDILEIVKKEMEGKKWDCFEQTVLHGRSGQQVAEALQISPSLVYTNTCRVLARARELARDFEAE